MKQKAAEAWRILNTFVGELVCAVLSLEIYEAPGFSKGVKENALLELRKMSLSYLFITLTKWVEFYDKYHNVLSPDIRPVVKAIKTKIEQKGIVDFRNNVVGHIWNKRVRRPLGKEEIEQGLERIIGPSPEAFFFWINDPANNVFPNTVVSVAEELRRRLEIDYALSDKDKFPWKEEQDRA